MNSNKTLCLQEFYVEAEVGIKRLTPSLRGEITMLPELFQPTSALFALTCFNSLTEDFTEGFGGLTVSMGSYFCFNFNES